MIKQIAVVFKSGHECHWLDVKGEVLTIEDQLYFETEGGLFVTLDCSEVAMFEIGCTSRGAKNEAQ